MERRQCGHYPGKAGFYALNLNTDIVGAANPTADVPVIETETMYVIGSNGIELHQTVINRSGLDTLARIGHGLKLPKNFTQVEWYGRGPWENYSDRKDAAMMGKYTGTPEAMHTSYIRPCECGGREDVRYVTLVRR